MGDVERHPAEADTEDARVVVRVATRIANVPASEWDACAAGSGEFQQDSIRPANPFVSHAFLKALEDSGYGELVHTRYNFHQIAALCKELTENGGKLPAAWDGVIQVEEDYKLGARSA